MMQSSSTRLLTADELSGMAEATADLDRRLDDLFAARTTLGVAGRRALFGGHDRFPHDELVHLFLNGHCAAFAVAAARALQEAGHDGVGISILVDEDGEPNSQDDRCVFHAYASCEGFDADARGVRTAGDMADEYEVGRVGTDGPFTEDEFLRFFCDEEGLEADPRWIIAAAEMIRRDPSLLRPRED